MNATVKAVVRRTVSLVAVASGCCAVQRHLVRKDGAYIFYGHRVASDDEGYLEGLRPDWLDAQLAYLARHYEIISLSDLVRCFETCQPVPSPSAVITFDDGFRDNLTAALPIVQKYRVPATVFLVTGCISSGELPWPQYLGYLFQHTSRTTVVAEVAGSQRELDLGSPPSRRRACLLVKEGLGRLPRSEREQQLRQWCRLLGVDPPRDRMLSWSEVKEMHAAGVEFGAHTYSHPWLACIPLDEAREEMQRSRDDLATKLGVVRPPFCFPGGSFTEELLAMVPRLGFASCFRPNPRQRLNSLATATAYSLGRVGLPNGPAVELIAEIDGPLPTLRRWFGRQVKQTVVATTR